jgi:hypothetical protein
MLLQYFEPGGERFLSFVKNKIKFWHGEMLRSGVRSAHRTVFVDDGTEIYVDMVLLADGIFRDKVRITGSAPRYIFEVNVAEGSGFGMSGFGEFGFTGITAAPDGSLWRTSLPGDLRLVDQLTTGNVVEGLKKNIKGSHPIYGVFGSPNGVSDGERLEVYQYQIQDGGLGPTEGLSAITGATLSPLAVCTYRAETDAFEPVLVGGIPRVPVLYNPLVGDEVHAWDAASRPVAEIAVSGLLWGYANRLMIISRKAHTPYAKTVYRLLPRRAALLLLRHGFLERRRHSRPGSPSLRRPNEMLHTCSVEGFNDPYIRH